MKRRITSLLCVICLVMGFFNTALADDSTLSWVQTILQASALTKQLLNSEQAHLISQKAELVGRMNAFISNNRWKNGAKFSNATVALSGAQRGCLAYATDFVHEVWQRSESDNRPGKNGVRFSKYDMNELSDGDIIHTIYEKKDSDGNDVNHYYCILLRNADGTLYTAEGNSSGKVAVSSSKHSMSNLKTYSSTYGTGNVENGWHMQEWYKNQGDMFVFTSNNSVRTGYFNDCSALVSASVGDVFTIKGTVVNSSGTVWYCVSTSKGSGWVAAGWGTKHTPETKTITNVNSEYVAPLHNDCYGAAAVVANANMNDVVTVVSTKKNSFGNLWYYVKYGSGYYWLWSEYCNPNAASTESVLGATHYLTISDPEMGLTAGSVSDGKTFDVNGATSYSIPDGATTITSIKNGGSLKSIVIPTSVKTIAANAFSGCSKLTAVTFKGTTAQWNAISIASEGNGKLTSATLTCQGDTSKTAAFTKVTATPATTDALLEATVTVTSGSGTFTGSGIRVYKNGTQIASKDEKHSYYRSASGTSSYNIWYDIKDELGVTLTAGTTYTYRFYSIFNGSYIWSDTKSFTTEGNGGLTMTLTFSEVTEESIVFSFRGTANNNVYGIYSEFGYVLTERQEGRQLTSYRNTSDANLGSNSGKKANYFAVHDFEQPVTFLTGGHTYGLQVYFIFDGVRYDSDIFTFTLPDTKPPVISDALVKDKTSTGYTVTCKATDNNAISNVRFLTWTTQGGKDDATWQDGVLDGSVWTCVVNSDNGHNGQADCEYKTEIYAYDRNGNSASCTLTHYVDTVPPVITDLVVDSVTAEGYRVTCKASDNYELTSVDSESWCAPGRTTSPAAELTDDTYEWWIRPSSLSYQCGYYTTMVYALDDSGNRTEAYVFAYVDAQAPTISGLTAANVTQNAFDAAFDVVDVGTGLAGVQVAVWSAENGQDDLNPDWETAESCAGIPLEHGGYMYHVSLSDHGGDRGLYYLRVRADDNFGNTSFKTVAVNLSGSTGAALGCTSMGRLELDGVRFELYRCDDAENALDRSGGQELAELLGGTLARIDDAQTLSACYGLLAGAVADGAEDIDTSGVWVAQTNYLNRQASGFGWGRNYVLTSLRVYPYSSSTDWRTPYFLVMNGRVEEETVSYATFLRLPDGVKHIGSTAFEGITVEAVILPTSCECVEAYAFANCPNLKYVIVPAGSGVSIDEYAFAGSRVKLIQETAE